MLSVVPTVVPTGGCISLAISGYSRALGDTMTISRAVSGISGLSTWTLLYSGQPCPLFLDLGDGLPQTPLASGTAYAYLVTDSSGTVQTPATVPTGSLVLCTDQLTPLLIALLQGAMNSLVFPPNFVSETSNPYRPIVSHAMPLEGLMPLPLITVTRTSVAQRYVPIGQDVTDANVKTGLNTVLSFAEQSWMVKVLCKTPDEREWLTDAIISVWRAAFNSVFGPLGQNISHNYNASVGQIADNTAGMMPGFYYADIALSMTGSYNVGIQFNDYIETIDVKVINELDDQLIIEVIDS